MKRALLVLSLCVSAVLGSQRIGMHGAGGLCTLMTSFIGGKKWSKDKVNIFNTPCFKDKIAAFFFFYIYNGHLGNILILVGRCSRILCLRGSIQINKGIKYLVKGPGHIPKCKQDLSYQIRPLSPPQKNFL